MLSFVNSLYTLYNKQFLISADYWTYCGYQTWSKLRVNPKSLYEAGPKIANSKVKLQSDLPRTVAEAEEKQWDKIENSCHGDKYEPFFDITNL